MLWLVILIFGGIVGTIGPLPSDVKRDECDARAVSLMNGVHAKYAQPGYVAPPATGGPHAGQPIHESDVNILCVVAAERPGNSGSLLE